MNVLVFAIATYLVLVLQIGLRPLLALPELGPGGVTPDLILIFLVWIGLMAPGSVVMWVALLLGVLVDATQGPIHGAQVLGPTTLGYVAGGLALLQLRGIVVRESVLTLAVSTLFVGIFVYLVIILVFTLRGLLIEPIVGWNTADQMVRGFQTLIYTVIVSVPMGLILFRAQPLFSFPRPRSDRYY